MARSSRGRRAYFCDCKNGHRSSEAIEWADLQSSNWWQISSNPTEDWSGWKYVINLSKVNLTPGARGVSSIEYNDESLAIPEAPTSSYSPIKIDESWNR